MTKLRCLVILLCSVVFAVADESDNKTWKTLDGNPPLVVARGGFSGIFPDSSEPAYHLATRFSLSNMISWCDVQMTNDGRAICLSSLKLENDTNVKYMQPNKKTSKFVNGVNTAGWFSSDLTLKDLAEVRLTQRILSRSSEFDYEYPILTVEDFLKLPVKPDNSEPRSAWLNIQYPTFFKDHGLSVLDYIYFLYTSSNANIKYVSSPDAVFLQTLRERKMQNGIIRPKFILNFLDKFDIEPSTEHSYGDLLKNLGSLKDYVDGILVPRSYLLPVDLKTLYLLSDTNSLVSDAHKVGLQVFVSGLSNDDPYAYDFNYDPIVEHLAFIDNGKFSVDGVLSDFPITPSAAIDCFAHVETSSNSAETDKKFVVISHQGASGVYAGCTDLAYKRAIDDGADIIDCPVQMTKDGVLICLGSINLMSRTDATPSSLEQFVKDVPELGGEGIFAFDLTFEEITSKLRPKISVPEKQYGLDVNPKFEKDGKFTTLWNLVQTLIEMQNRNNSHVPNLWINIENAAYLDEKNGWDVTAAVFQVLKSSNYNNIMQRRAIIHSTEEEVLKKCFNQVRYECAYEYEGDNSELKKSAVGKILSYTHSVVLNKAIIFSETKEKFLADDDQSSDFVMQMHRQGLKVYAKLFRNEFVYQSWDFFSDPYVELNTFVEGRKLDGVITDYPRTAYNYRSRNRCLQESKRPNYMMPIKPGELFKFTRSAPYQTVADNNKKNRRLGEGKRTVRSDQDAVTLN